MLNAGHQNREKAYASCSAILDLVICFMRCLNLNWNWSFNHDWENRWNRISSGSYGIFHLMLSFGSIRMKTIDKKTTNFSYQKVSTMFKCPETPPESQVFFCKNNRFCRFRKFPGVAITKFDFLRILRHNVATKRYDSIRNSATIFRRISPTHL